LVLTSRALIDDDAEDMRRLSALMLLVIAVMAGAVAASNAVAASAAGTAAPASASTLPSAAEIDAYLAGKGSPMAGQGSAFLASGGRWQIDPRLLVAIAGAESNFGSITCAPFNAWGYGCPNGPYEFTSWADGIDAVAQGLRTNYLAEGRTSVALINLKYAPIGAANDPTGLNNNWTINVSRFLIELGGDPNDIDIDHVAGTRLLGAAALGGSGTGAGFDFSEAASAAPAAKAALEIVAGEPRPLTISVTNTGTTPWNASNVRLARVDDESRVGGDPYGSVANGIVKPGGVAKFVVLLAARGSHDGTADTQWRVEGPSGPFGPVIERSVAFAVPVLAAGPGEATATPQGAGQGADSTWTVQVRIQNTGAAAWVRDGDDRVLLGLRTAVGSDVRGIGWINERVPATLLQRDVQPGEFGTFAFRVQGTDAALALQVFTATGWASGGATIAVLGDVAEDVTTDLAERYRG
jgi:hypothetical protein